jgi:predicted aspartyl protease
MYFPHPKKWGILLILAVLCCQAAVRAERPGWKRHEVDWRLTGGTRIKAIYYPADKPPPNLSRHSRRPPTLRRKEILPSSVTTLGEQASTSVFAYVIDSPPIAGFVPWIVVSPTDEHISWDINAYASGGVVGNYLAENAQSDYAIGIFDTGASVNVISDDDAVKTRIDPNWVTSLPVDLIGATGTATAYTTDPLGIFIGGLDLLEPNGLLLDDSNMLGEYNVSVLAGDPIESPNLPTAIGAPMAVYLNAAFWNSEQLSVTIDGNDFNSPYIRFYSIGDPCTPSFCAKIGLELRPSDAAAVQYFPCDILLMCGGEPDGTPLIPSTMWGFLSNQSLYFLPRVDLEDGDYTAPFNDKFMFDTGAQITVISYTMAAGLHLNTNNPDFPVEIQDVTGQITIEPGFYIDSLVIPAINQWLEYTNVPVVVLDVQSPEGGLLDGIIGMNLFVDLNFVFKGGGFQYNPQLEFEPTCNVTADIAPACGDCKVDYLDLEEFVKPRAYIRS